MQMGTRDNSRPARPTKPYDPSKLAALTAKPLAETRAASPAEPLPVTSRTATVHDPLTTELLAEVTRRSQTLDFEDGVLDKMLDKVDGSELPDRPARGTGHPRTKRRDR